MVDVAVFGEAVVKVGLNVVAFLAALQVFPADNAVLEGAFQIVGGAQIYRVALDVGVILGPVNGDVVGINVEGADALAVFAQEQLLMDLRFKLIDVQAVDVQVGSGHFVDLTGDLLCHDHAGTGGPVLVRVHQVFLHGNAAGRQNFAAVQEIHALFVEQGHNLLGDFVAVIQHLVALGHLLVGIDGGMLVDKQEGNLAVQAVLQAGDFLNLVFHGHIVLQIEKMAAFQGQHLACAGVHQLLAQGILEAGIEIAQLRGLVQIARQIAVQGLDSGLQKIPLGVILRILQIGFQVDHAGAFFVNAFVIGGHGHDAEEKDHGNEDHRQHDVDLKLQLAGFVFHGLYPHNDSSSHKYPV